MDVAIVIWDDRMAWKMVGKPVGNHPEICLCEDFLMDSSRFSKKKIQRPGDGLCPRSMYGIFTYIWLIFMVNVAKWTIHGSDGCLMMLDHLRKIVEFVLDLPMMGDTDAGSVFHDG